MRISTEFISVIIFIVVLLPKLNCLAHLKDLKIDDGTNETMLNRKLKEYFIKHKEMINREFKYDLLNNTAASTQKKLIPMLKPLIVFGSKSFRLHNILDQPNTSAYRNQIIKEKDTLSNFESRKENIPSDETGRTINITDTILEKESQYMDYELIHTFNVVEEMQINKDQRHQRSLFSFVLNASLILQIFSIISMKIAYSKESFPINLVFNMKYLSLIELFLNFLLLNSESNYHYQKFLTVNLSLIQILFKVINLTYFGSVIVLKLYPYKDLNRNNSKPANITSRVSRAAGTIQLLSVSITVLLNLPLFGSKLKLKSCFKGSCLAKQYLKFRLDSLPSLIESLTISSMILLLKVGELINKAISNKQNDTAVFQTGKLLWFEFLLLSLSATSYFSKSVSEAYFKDFRQDEYASFQDYLVICRSFLLFLTFVLNRKIISEWKTLMVSSDEQTVSEAEIKDFLQCYNQYSEIKNEPSKIV